MQGIFIYIYIYISEPAIFFQVIHSNFLVLFSLDKVRAAPSKLGCYSLPILYKIHNHQELLSFLFCFQYLSDDFPYGSFSKGDIQT